MTYEREVPKMNKESFPTWKILMRLYIFSISDDAINVMDNEYVKIKTIPLTTQQLKEKKEHNHAILEITSALSFAEFDDIKYCDNAK